MEAANLGARLAGQFAVLSEAIAQLGTTPDYARAETLWVAAALQVLAQTRATDRSIGIPTWFYGHEPTNASKIGRALCRERV